MKAVHLALICHAPTHALKTGYLHGIDDALSPGSERPSPAAPGTQLLSAPERRALETAACLGTCVGIEPALADCDLGRWQGQALKHLQAEQPQALAQWLDDPHSAPHGGESIAALCQRVGAWLEGFDPPGDWLAVTHPFVIRAAMVHVLGCPLEAFQRIDVLPLSRLPLSRVGRWRLRLA
ncbi:histidine phosphatase family protein [Pseudomonas sp. I2]|uniref:histidine phosphatase family protein n=1 Tax=unclassified Pseudomonas TaxID=196821 RepID=UPI0034D76AFF